MPVIPDKIRHVIVDRMRNGGSQRKVGLELNICQATVNRIWMKYRRIGTTDNQPRSGRHKKTTEREWRNFCRLLMQKSFSFPKQLLSEVHFENNTSPRSSRRMLSSRGLFGRISSRKPLLSKAQIYKRISFARPTAKCQVMSGAKFYLQTKWE